MYDNEYEREENNLFETKPNLNQGQSSTETRISVSCQNESVV